MNNKIVKSSLVPALEKGLDVVEFLAQADIAYSLSQLAKELKRSVSELQRTVQCLLDRGYLYRDPVGGYRLSAKLFSIAHSHPPHRSLLLAALPALDWFTKETRQSIHLSVPQGLDLVIIGQVESKTPARITIQNGLCLDYTTTSGKIFLAHLPPLQQKMILQTCDFSSAEQAKMAKELERAKKEGHWLSASHSYEGLTDLAIPLIAPSTCELHAVLASTWIQPREKKVSSELILRKLKETATKILQSWSADC